MEFLVLLAVCAAVWLVLKAARHNAGGLDRRGQTSLATAQSELPHPDRDAWEGSFWEVEDPFPSTPPCAFATWMVRARKRNVL